MFTWLLLLVPLSVALAAVTTPTSLWTFAVATAAVVPLAESIRRATEHLARRAGPAIGGLLNVSFGNTPELVLALFVLASAHSHPTAPLAPQVGSESLFAFRKLGASRFEQPRGRMR